jgi:hypothetical protein
VTKSVSCIWAPVGKYRTAHGDSKSFSHGKCVVELWWKVLCKATWCRLGGDNDRDNPSQFSADGPGREGLTYHDAYPHVFDSSKRVSRVVGLAARFGIRFLSLGGCAPEVCQVYQSISGIQDW